jgi:uncharacterized protein (DUF885 family)
MREHQGDDPITTARFRDVATRVLDALLEASPEQATDLGDHRFDDRLTDWSAEAAAARATMLTEALAALDDVDDTGLILDDRVDLEILRTQVTGNLWELTELRPHERDPLMHLPGEGLYPLIAREATPVADRLRALTGRLSQVPDRLATAREVLHDLPRVQVETAIVQLKGTAKLLTDELEPLLQAEPGLAARVESAREEALTALTDHVRWLEAQLPVADGDPRLGEQSYAARLWYTLDTETGPDALLTRAESDLQAIEEELAELASELAGAPPRDGQVREMLDRSAAMAPVTDATILPLCQAALAQLTARVIELDLVSVPEAPVQIIVMPEARRGVAVAYCDAPGPLEPGAADGSLPTFFAVSPTPEDWDAERVASFYREYNGHMLRNLAVHEAMPGHVLQLAQAARYRGATRVRSAGGSGPFIEGWAVYAEELLAASGFGGTPEEDAGLRLQQLKMQLRSTINAILDVRVHSRGMTEAEAMQLMTIRGHQEEGEAAGKWRRALLTSTQLSTYYVGYRELSDIARQLRSSRPGWSVRQVHDAMLAHGAPPPRHLRTLLDLEPPIL